MYEAHFGFSGSPFQLNPDPAFYFNSRGHGHALAYLRYGVSQGEGFIVVTGEIGAGKTTLLRALLGELDRAQVVAAQIVSTQLESGDLLQAIITAFGIPTNGSGKASLIATLEAFLMTLATQGRRALLVIDEAQNLEIRAIEELRMLSNFQLGTQSLLQSFLVGQPELRKKLESPEMEQLRQRVTASCHLGPLGPEETQAYIEHRLRRVGWMDRPRFEGPAFDQIYRWTGGVPRRINRLCNRLLLAAFLEGRSDIDPLLVENTAKELRHEIGEGSFEPVDLPTRREPQEALPPTVVDEPLPAPDAVAVVPAAVAEPEVQEAKAIDSPALPSSAIEAAVAPLPQPVDVVAPTHVLTAVPTEVQAVAPRYEQTEVPAAALAPEQEPAEVVAAPVQPAAQQQPAVVRVRRPDARDNVPSVLCVADSMSAALKLALIAKTWASKARAPRLVLVNPGSVSCGWPWEEMRSLLPSFEMALHLGRRSGSLEVVGGDLFAHFAAVIDELAPRAVLVMGESDAMLGCALLARKRDIPVLRLEAGMEPDADALNAALIEQCADAVFTPSTADALQRLHRRGVPASKVFAVPGSLSADLVQTMLPAMTTPYGAFLRHRLPIFLGPRWSAEVDGTAYALVTLSLDGQDDEGIAALMSVLVDLSAVPKLVWLADEQTRSLVRRWQAEQPERANDVFIIEDDMPREALDQRNSARILCCDIRSLPDQLSIMRGAVCVITEPGHAVSAVSSELGIPRLLLQGGRLQITVPDQEPLERPWSVVVLNDCLRGFVAEDHPAAPRAEAADESCVAATVLAMRLQRWIDERLQSGWADRPVGLVAAPDNLPPPQDTAAAA